MSNSENKRKAAERRLAWKQRRSAPPEQSGIQQMRLSPQFEETNREKA